MPRNSHDNSLDRFMQVRNLTKTYLLKPRCQYLVFKNQSNRIKRNIKIIGKIDKAWDELIEPYKTIFNNTFFETKNYDWWKGLYSKTTFYRLREQAIKEFLGAIKIYEK